MLLVAPWRKHLTFTFGSIDSGDLHDIRHAPATSVGRSALPLHPHEEPPTDELVVFSARRVHKNRNSL